MKDIMVSIDNWSDRAALILFIVLVVVGTALLIGGRLRESWVKRRDREKTNGNQRIGQL